VSTLISASVSKLMSSIEASDSRREDLYFRALLVCLACYAIIGKGFAYLGVPPVFVGEILLAIGLWIWVGKRFVGLNTSAPAQLVLLCYVRWGALRTMADVGN